MKQKALVIAGLLTILVAGVIVFTATKINTNNLSAASSLAKNFPATQTDFSDFMALQKKIEDSLLKGNSKSIIADLVLRKEKLKKIILDSPRTLNLIALDRSSFSQLGKAGLDNIEEDATLSGVITSVHYDDFQNPENAKMVYTFTSGAMEYDLHPLNEDSVISNEPVVVTGKKIDKIFVADKITKDNVSISRGVNQALPQGASPGLTLFHHNVAVFLINHPSSSPDPFAPVDVKENINGKVILSHNTNGEIGAYYREQSYGKVRFLTTTYGWYTLPDNFLTPCYVDQPDLENYLISNGISFNIQAFDHVVIIENCNGGAVLGGSSTVGKSTRTMLGRTGLVSWARVGGDAPTYLSTYDSADPHPFQWTNFDHVFSHEIGHSLGNVHAHEFSCDSVVDPLGPPCQKIEYGNAFDVMGSGYYSTHLNAWYKELLGWVDQSNILTITQSGSYVISGLEEAPLNQNQKLEAKIMIPGVSNIFYEVEHRRAYGFDAKLGDANLTANTRGLFISKIVNNQSYLLDIQPTTSGFFTDLQEAVLPSSLSHGNGPTFSDPRAGIIIGPVVGTILNPVGGPKNIRFSVQYQPITCTHQSPVYVPGIISTHPGQSSYRAFVFVNNDYYNCPPSDFLMSFSLPVGFTAQNGQYSSPAVPPDGDISSSFILYVDPIVIPGNYQGAITITNTTTGTFTTQNFNIQVNP